MTLLASSCSLSEVLSSGRNVEVAMIRVIDGCHQKEA